MDLKKKLSQKRKELESLLDVVNLKEIQPTKLLKLLISEINSMDKIFSLKEQNDFINRIFDVEISYNAYYKFYRNYVKNNNLNNQTNVVDSDKLAYISEESKETKVKPKNLDDLIGK